MKKRNSTFTDAMTAAATMDRSTVLELAAQYLAETLREGDAFERPEEVKTFLRCKLDRRDREFFGVMFLDTRHRLIAYEELFSGTIDGASVYPRVVARRALELNAAALILAHNHPSGVSEPSLADQAVTRRIKDALALLEIRLLDHVVIGDGQTTSMAERGLI